MADAFRLAFDMVLRPFRAVGSVEAAGGRALRSAGGVYLAYLLASAGFSAWKPADFPAMEAAEAAGLLGGTAGGGGPLHWLRVEAASAAMMAAFIALAVWFARALAGGRLSLKFFLCGLFTLVPAGLSLAYLTPAPGTPVWPLALVWLVLAAALSPGMARAERGLWPPVASFLLAANAVYFAVLPLFVAAVLMRSEGLYLNALRGMALWMLALSAYGVGRLAGVPTARAMCAVVFAAVWQSCLLHALFRLGMISKDTLAAMMTL